jgi:hypothetical protein
LTDPIQFEEAEPLAPTEEPALTCAACGCTITQRYFEVNGKVACGACEERVTSERSSRRPTRFLKALSLGILAGGVGAGIYYAVSAATGYEFGLIGIVVGFLVGAAVKHGAGGRGGRTYQVMAVILTYVAIVSTYVPYMIRGWEEKSAKEEAAVSSPQAAPPSPPVDSAQTGPSVAAAAAPATSATASTAPAASERAGDPEDSTAAPTLGGFLLAILMLVGIILAVPFLGGASNLMGLAIIGFSLWEAWKLNRAPPLVVRGPFSVDAGG